LWALPLLAALLFSVGVATWDHHNSRAEQEEAHSTLISDALSTEAQLRSRLDVEAAHLRTLTTQLARLPRQPSSLSKHPEVDAGLRRLWLSVTWLDGNNRILAHVPELDTRTGQDPASRDSASRTLVDDPSGLSAHLVAPVRLDTTIGSRYQGADAEANRFDIAGEKIVVRFAPSVLLKRETPWWLARRYEVQLVDGADQVIATLDPPGTSGHAPPSTTLPSPWANWSGTRDSYRVNVSGGMPGTYLQLTQREALPPWWWTLPWGLMLGFLALMGLATVLLRRQVEQVSRAEAAWRTEVAWRKAMEDSALVGLRARDGEGRLLYVNRTFCDMVGHPQQALVGMKPPMPYWPPDAVEDAMRRSRRNLAGLAPREGYEARWQHADGHALDVMVFESPLVDARGQQIGWMGSIIDITTHKQLEERERRQMEALSHRARLITLGEIGSALAHQLNQPLTAVAGYCAGVQRILERQGGADPLVLQALARLAAQVTEAGRIVQRIRAFLTRQAPEPQPCELRTLAERALGLLRRDWQRLGIAPQVDPGPPAWALADPVLLEQVLINLLRNAMDELARQDGPRRIELSLHAQDGQWCLVVDDNGPGLHGHSLETLARPFGSAKPDSMGMGLAICRSIIEALHGGMEAGRSPLGGARFAFTLPICPPPEAQAPQPTPATDPLPP
jgi:two-component system sensor histidine kinase DctS